MEYLAIFVVGFFIGANYAANVIRKQIHNAAKEAGVLKEEPEIKVAPVLTLEKHGNTYYLFDKKTDTFLCQSNDINELGQKLVEYKDIKLAYVQDDENQVFWFVNGKVASSPQ